MRHHVDKRKLGRTSAHRKAMFANMLSSLILNDRIETTLPKAKELRRIADRIVTLGKQQTLHARRRAIALIRDKSAVRKVFDDLAKRFEARRGGYTRIYKLGYRHGDSAPMALIEYLSHDGEGVKEEKATAKKPKPKLKAKAKAKVAGEEKKARKRGKEKAEKKEAKGTKKAAAKAGRVEKNRAKKRDSGAKRKTTSN